MWSGFSTGLSVAQGCPGWPPDFLPFLPRRLFGLGLLRSSFEGGLLLLRLVTASLSSNARQYATKTSSRSRWPQSCSSAAVFMAENFPKPGRQGVEVDVFDWYAHGGISILATTPGCLSNQLPIGGPITGASKAVAFDKGLYQVERMPVFMLPIHTDSLQDDGQQMARQMRSFDPGQDEKTSIVRYL